jgi:hypothetical protein
MLVAFLRLRCLMCLEVFFPCNVIDNPNQCDLIVFAILLFRAALSKWLLLNPFCICSHHLYQFKFLVVMKNALSAMLEMPL